MIELVVLPIVVEVAYVFVSMVLFVVFAVVDVAALSISFW